MIQMKTTERGNQTRTNEDTERYTIEPETSSGSNLQCLRSPRRLIHGPPDGGFGWVVVVASMVAHLLGDGIAYSFGVFATEIIQHFDTSRTIIGCMGSIIIGTTLCSGPLVSIICSKWGYRIPAVVGALTASIGFAVPFFCDRLWLIITMTSAVAGFGFGLIYLPSILVVNTYFEKKRALALGIAVCGSGIGTFVLSPFIEFLISVYGWQGAMLIVSGLLLNIIPCGLLYRSLVSNNGLGTDVEDNEENGKSKHMAGIKTVLSNPLFLLFAMSNFLTSIGFNAPYLYAKDRAFVAGISAAKSSFLISSIGIGNCMGRIFFGFLATTKIINRFHIYNVSLIVSGVFLVTSWGAHNYYWMICYTGMFGLMAGTYVTLTSIVLVDLLGIAHLNLAFGLVAVSQGIAEFIGPPLVGAVYDATKSYDGAFTFSGAFLIFSGVMMFGAYLSRPFRQRSKTFTQ